MRAWLGILAIGFFCGCSQERDKARSDDFFRDWLEHHGEKQVVVDASGVGIAASATRLKTSVYESKKVESGGYTVELEFKIRLPAGGEIVEYVAGMGETKEQATNDAMANFTLTTFHVVYKAFMNPSDPHQKVQEATIAGQKRELFLGDIYLRGSEGSRSIDLESLRPQIQAAIVAIPLTSEPHWIKIVYSQNKGQPVIVAVTLDNQDHTALTDAIGKLNWPPSDGFYMAKQFIVVK